MKAKLYRNGEFVCDADVAKTFSQRLCGLLRYKEYTDAMVFFNTTSVHSMGMRMTIDVIYCTSDGRVVAVDLLKPNRIGSRHATSTWIVEMACGNAIKHGINVGDVLLVSQ